MKKRVSETESIWNSILLGNSKEPRTIHFAKLFALFDLPIKTRNVLKISGVSYIPITFQSRDPASIKRKLNRWRQKRPNLELLKEMQGLIDKKFSLSEITIIEVPTNRDSVCTLFLLIKNAFFVVWLLNDDDLEYRMRKQSGFKWDKYDCKVLALSKKKFWEALGERSHRAMQDPIRNMDSGLFEFVLLNGLNMADLKRTTWRAHHRGFYTPTLSKFLEALLKFFEKSTRKTSKKIR